MPSALALLKVSSCSLCISKFPFGLSSLVSLTIVPPMHLPGLCPPATRVIQLPRSSGEPISLTMQPLSLGFHRRLRGRGVVPPEPPRKVARDSAGKPLRDPSGLAILTSDDRHPDYLNHLDLYHQRVAVLAIVESLMSDPQVTFTSQRPSTSDPEAWCRYADALFEEMETAGMTAGDLAILSQWTCRLSHLLDSDLQGATQNFSREPPHNST